MLTDDLRGMWYIMLKDLGAYYLKPPYVSWGILFPVAFVLAFAIHDPGNLEGLVPGLLALTLLFGASSMEAIVITFERRIGALERLLLAPIRLPALLAGKILGGVAFGLATTLLVFGLGGVDWLLLLLTMVLSAAAFSAMGALVSVAVKEVFEAQTLANAFRFPMMFLGGGLCAGGIPATGIADRCPPPAPDLCCGGSGHRSDQGFVGNGHGGSCRVADLYRGLVWPGDADPGPPVGILAAIRHPLRFPGASILPDTPCHAIIAA
jgi:ABC-2 type transport system permease protein